MNNASLDNVTHEQAVGILKSSSDTVVLLVYRDNSSFVYEGSSPPQSPVEETGTSILQQRIHLVLHRGLFNQVAARIACTNCSLDILYQQNAKEKRNTMF